MRFPAVLAILAFAPLESPAQAATGFNVLHTFAALSGRDLANNDGASPCAALVLDGQTLFGATSQGGSAGFGTLFQVNTDGSGFVTLYNFTNGTDGATPMASLLKAGEMLYGTASAGGPGAHGTIFSFDTGATNFSTLYAFTNGEDGATPKAGLVLSGNALYGTTSGTISGPSYGTLFKINTNGSDFVVLHRFSAPSSIRYTNGDGFLLSGPLFASSNAVYGVATQGGANGCGTIFTNAGDAPDFGAAYTFAAAPGFPGINGGGANPQGGVVQAGAILFGAATDGGADGWGTVYQYDLAGSGISALYCFTDGQDYSNPQGPLALSGNMLFGTTPATIFELATNGATFTNLFIFPSGIPNGSGHVTNATGLAPNGGLAMSGQALYGTAQQGGSNGFGTIFAFNLGPSPSPLIIQQAPGNVVLTWTDPGLTLQSASALDGIFTNVPAAASPFTNAPSGAQMFFRLQGN